MWSINRHLTCRKLRSKNNPTAIATKIESETEDEIEKESEDRNRNTEINHHLITATIIVACST